VDVGGFAKIEFGYGIESTSMGTRAQRPGYTNGWDLYSYDAMGFGCEAGWRRPPCDMTCSTFLSVGDVGCSALLPRLSGLWLFICLPGLWRFGARA
jgi:hypothetical protein